MYKILIRIIGGGGGEGGWILWKSQTPLLVLPLAVEVMWKFEYFILIIHTETKYFRSLFGFVVIDHEILFAFSS